MASKLLVKFLNAGATLPAKGSSLAAGFDLAAAEATTVLAGSKAIVKTGLSIAIPEGTYARLAPRSGLAAKKGVDVGAGVVDFDYRGEVGVILFNHGAENFEVAKGDRVAQLLLEKVSMCGCKEVESLEETARGAGGFGSTGVSKEAEAEPAAKMPRSEKAGPSLMLVKKLCPEACLPVRGSSHAAGFDLAASQAVEVPAGGKAIVKTGLSIAIPAGTYARIAPRSGLAAKKMLHTGAGVVDYDYRGEVGVVMFNYGKEPFAVAPGDRVAQLILEEVDMCGCVEVESLDETARGAGGFGSTGVDNAVASTAAAGTPAAADAKQQQLLVKKLRPEAVLPVKGSADAAGFDLSAAEAVTVPAGGKAIVKTGLSVATPLDAYARIAPRSGLAAKKMIHVGAGVVDADYRGEVGVVLFNHGTEPFEVKPADRVAQMILEKIAMVPCEKVDSLDTTARGDGGFGSTGVSEKVAGVPPVPAAEKCGA
eukprot:TRINITY_DN5488_c0_g1_i1.p1 TRINITY_DN5488_c0_g1~~TRINITY_DN5488_c0_g1_i1.p1  ORF type:complete len:481 (-),score=166.13 TRINITY_DN5488_c0_g1_i1:235-1677(-)